jgi:hypothetical protein
MDQLSRVVFAPRVRAHELVFCALSFGLGMSYLLGAPPPASAAAQMPGWLVHAWAAGLAISGAAGLTAAMITRWRETSLTLEAGAMLMGAGALILVAVAIAAAIGMAGLFGAAFCLAWAIANLFRAVQIRRELAELLP